MRCGCREARNSSSSTKVGAGILPSRRHVLPFRHLTTVAIVGGYGVVGGIAAREISMLTHMRLRIGGRHAVQAASAAANLGGAESGAVDAGDPESVRAFVDGCDIVLFAGPSDERRRIVMIEALAARAHFVDAGTPDGAQEFAAELHEGFVGRDRSCILGASWFPGFSEILLVHAFEEVAGDWAEIDDLSIAVFFRGTLGVAGVQEAAEATERHDLRMGSADGVWKPLPPKTVDFGGDVGSQVVHASFPPSARRLAESLGIPRAVRLLAYHLGVGFGGPPSDMMIAFARGLGFDGRPRSRRWIVGGRKGEMPGLVPAVAIGLLECGSLRTGAHLLCRAAETATVLEALRGAGVDVRREIA
jgi:hypothetical protein